MREYVITTDSTVDLPKEYLKEHQITYLPLSYMIDGNTYKDMSGLTHKEFFDHIRKGSMPTTSQVNPSEAKEAFEPIIKEGKDILHIGFSSGLSGSYHSAAIAAKELLEKYPEAKITVIDSLCASLGEGLLLHKAVERKEQGMAMDELAAWIEENKLHVCTCVTVDDLFHLQRGGRVSKASAIFGSMVQIKPIICVDDAGQLQVTGKERGRKKSLNKLVAMMGERLAGWEEENELAAIAHGDCIEDAEYVAQQIKERFGVKEVLINGIGTVIGSHTGPGVVVLFFMGNKR
ncbi:MAG: DegV family protein [Hespellia sp.]|nr:DegV family protein [Hespellia sp.]